MTRKNGGGAPFRFCNDRPTFTSEPWKHGLFEPDHSANPTVPFAGLRFGLERTNPRRIDIVLPTPFTVVNESIMLHRYEHGLILYCDSDPIWTRLRRMGACTILSSHSWSLTPCRSTTHVAGILQLPSLRTHLASRFRICTVPHRAVHAVSLQSKHIPV